MDAPIHEIYSVFIDGDFYTLYMVDDQAPLEKYLDDMQAQIDEKLAGEQKQVLTHYVHTDLHIMSFYTVPKREEWWTL